MVGVRVEFMSLLLLFLNFGFFLCKFLEYDLTHNIIGVTLVNGDDTQTNIVGQALLASDDVCSARGRKSAGVHMSKDHYSNS